MNSTHVSALIDRDAQTHATLTHLSGIVSCFVIPLIVYLLQQDKSSLLADAAREALNFQITLAIAWFAALAAMSILIGFLLLPLIGIFGLVCCVIAAVATARGERYRYPLALRLIA